MTVENVINRHIPILNLFFLGPISVLSLTVVWLFEVSPNFDRLLLVFQLDRVIRGFFAK